VSIRESFGKSFQKMIVQISFLSMKLILKWVVD